MHLCRLLVSVVAMGLAAGCGQYGVSGPNDLGLAARLADAPLPVDMGPDVASLTSEQLKVRRNAILNRWIAKSDFLCSDYQLSLSREIRDSRLATDILATALTGAATIFAKPAVTRPLTGAATIALGIGGDIQSDLFLQQASDVVSTAIQTVRTQARTTLLQKQTAEYADYVLEQGLVDVQRYDRETCNLNVGLNAIRASLNGVGPPPQSINPVVPLPPPGSGVAPGLGGPAAAGPPPATVVVPPSVQKTPTGQIVFTPGSVASVPVVQPPPPPPPPPPRKVTPRLKLPPSPPEAAPARMQLFQALGQGPDGKNPPDPARVAFMKQCWNELLKPVPTNFSLWLDSASSETLASVTDCINRKSASPESGSH